MDDESGIYIISIIILLFLSAFFSISETAFTAVNKIRIKSLADDGMVAAKRAQGVLENYRKMLSAILICNNVVNLSAAALCTAFAIKVWGDVAVGIATGILSFVIILGAEILPKTIASLYAEKIVLACSIPILIIMKLLTPVIFIVDSIAQGFIRLFRISPLHKDAMTETELKTYVDVGHEDGVIEADERAMIYNVFEFSDTKARDVMIPRINMVALGAQATYDEMRAIFAEHMYTRYPVYREDKDVIVGLVNIKDFLLVAEDERASFRAEHILREGYYTYESKKTADLLDDMRDDSVNMAFVLDEYGLTAGMITIEDLLEEIVGEIRDEYDDDEKELIQKIDETSYLVEGGMKIDDINDALDLKLFSAEYDSIGGLMIESLVRLPAEGETVEVASGVILSAREVSGNRIEKVLLTLPASE